MVNAMDQFTLARVLVGETTRYVQVEDVTERVKMAILSPFFVHYPASKQSDEFIEKYLHAVIGMEYFKDLFDKLGWSEASTSNIAHDARTLILLS